MALSADLGLVVTAATGGAAGSIMALIASYLRDKRKERLLRSRARALVKHELQTAKDFIQTRLIDPATQSKDMIYLPEHATEIQSTDNMIESLQYPSMNTEIKLISFDPSLQGDLQDAYLKIKNMKTFRYSSLIDHAKVFGYGRSYLMNLVADIDTLIKKIT